MRNVLLVFGALTLLLALVCTVIASICWTMNGNLDLANGMFKYLCIETAGLIMCCICMKED